MSTGTREEKMNPKADFTNRELQAMKIIIDYLDFTTRHKLGQVNRALNDLVNQNAGHEMAKKPFAKVFQDEAKNSCFFKAKSYLLDQPNTEKNGNSAILRRTETIMLSNEFRYKKCPGVAQGKSTDWSGHICTKRNMSLDQAKGSKKITLD